MVLPVSMEDFELFPKNKRLAIPERPTKFLANEFLQMHDKMSRVWWSRLVIAVRGYVVNYVHESDEALFLIDDAFIILHQHVVEADSRTAQKFLLDLEVVVNVDEIVDILSNLDNGDLRVNPFTDYLTRAAFERIFGQPNAATYKIANAQKFAYVIFMDVLSVLQQRWLLGVNKRKGIRFEEDPEWQPDDRVVLFQHFFRGNRTWVLTDFDRHVLSVWRPNGSAVIFGDRFIEEKKKCGFALCAFCGMLEPHVEQFMSSHGLRFCSEKCESDYRTGQRTS